jgi:hypothetical protein
MPRPIEADKLQHAAFLGALAFELCKAGFRFEIRPDQYAIFVEAKHTSPDGTRHGASRVISLHEISNAFHPEVYGEGVASSLVEAIRGRV